MREQCNGKTAYVEFLRVTVLSAKTKEAIVGSTCPFFQTKAGCPFAKDTSGKPIISPDYIVVCFYFKNHLKDVRAHCYCASLVGTLYMTWHVPRHVFQARALSRNSIKYRADDLCGNLICEYFCWIIGDPHFFFGRSLPFLILSIILKNKKNLCGRF